LSAAFLPGLASYVDSKTFATLSGYISVFILTLFLFTPVFINLVAMRLPQILRLRGRMRYGLRYLKILTNNPFLCGKILLVSLIAQLSFFLSVFALGGDAVTGLTFLQMMTVLPMISLVASLPISIGGWGVREGAFVYGLGLLGVPMETAFLLSIQVGLISMLVTVLAGMPALMASNLPMARLSAVKKSLLKLKF
jgi:glycosyltransferase 2 family protein